MIGWILAVLALFTVQTLLPNVARVASGDAAQKAWLRSNRDDPPPDTVMGSMAAQAFEPANGGLLRGGSSLLTQGSPLLSTPAGSMF